jgi:hypothetical protein
VSCFSEREDVSIVWGPILESVGRFKYYENLINWQVSMI